MKEGNENCCHRLQVPEVQAKTQGAALGHWAGERGGLQGCPGVPAVQAGRASPGWEWSGSPGRPLHPLRRVWKLFKISYAIKVISPTPVSLLRGIMSEKTMPGSCSLQESAPPWWLLSMALTGPLGARASPEPPLPSWALAWVLPGSPGGAEFGNQLCPIGCLQKGTRDSAHALIIILECGI